MCVFQSLINIQHSILLLCRVISLHEMRFKSKEISVYVVVTGKPSCLLGWQEKRKRRALIQADEEEQTFLSAVPCPPPPHQYF